MKVYGLELFHFVWTPQQYVAIIPNDIRDVPSMNHQ